MLIDQLKKYNVILASGSPRRQQFLKDLLIEHTIQLKEVEEIYPDTLVKGEITEFLAKLKAKAFNNLSDKDILITSDTIVWDKNKCLGKPNTKKEAIEMMKGFSNNKHHVFTSICLKSANKEVVFTDKTTVYFEKLSKEEIEFYVNKFKPFDKAGSYGIQEWIGLIGVKKLKGSYFNVMGFPVHKLYKELSKFIQV